jgi:hypothetical protein
VDQNYTLTRPADTAEFENPELSWTAKGLLFYAQSRAQNPVESSAFTVAQLQANSPGRESNDELRSALEELVAAGLMQVAE